MDHFENLSDALSRADTLLLGSVVPTPDILQQCYSVAEDIVKRLRERQVPASAKDTTDYNRETQNAMDRVSRLAAYQEHLLDSPALFKNMASIVDLKQLCDTPMINMLEEGTTELAFGPSKKPLFNLDLASNCEFLNSDNQWTCLGQILQESNIRVMMTMHSPQRTQEKPQDLLQPFQNEVYTYPVTIADMQDNDREIDNLARDMIDSLTTLQNETDPDEICQQHDMIHDMFERLDDDSQEALLHQLQVYANECEVAGKDFYSPETIAHIAGMEQEIDNETLAIAL